MNAPHRRPRRFRLWHRPALAVLAALAWAGPAAADAVTDSAGRTVAVPEAPRRVLAAGPPAAILLYTLAPERMVGWVTAPAPAARTFLTPATRDLPAYGRLTGRGGTANVEAVLALKPDLVIDVGSLGPTYASLADRVQAQTGIPYLLLDGSLAQTPATYRRLGRLLGEAARGEDLAAAAQALMDAVAAAVAGVPEAERPRVYYARGRDGLETGLSGSINSEILPLAGARNAAAPAGPGGLAAVSPEQVLAWDPDVILTVDPEVRARFRGDPLWRSLRAVREGRVLLAPALPFGWFDAPPGVNRLIGLRWLAATLHPGRFAEPLPEAVQAFYRRFYHHELDPAQRDRLLGDAAASRP